MGSVCFQGDTEIEHWPGMDEVYLDLIKIQMERCNLHIAQICDF